MTDERKFHHHDKASLDSEERLRLVNPDLLIALLPLTPGDTWADVGCGTGTMTIPLARALRSGWVVALDVQPEMVSHTKERVAREGLANVEVRETGEPKLELEDGSVDGLVASFVLHEAASQRELIAESRRVVKPNGHALVVEFVKGAGGHGPPDELRIAPEHVAQMLSEGGFDPGEVRHLGDSIYLFIARRLPTD